MRTLGAIALLLFLPLSADANWYSRTSYVGLVNFVTPHVAYAEDYTAKPGFGAGILYEYFSLDAERIQSIGPEFGLLVGQRKFTGSSRVNGTDHSLEFSQLAAEIPILIRFRHLSFSAGLGGFYSIGPKVDITVRANGREVPSSAVPGIGLKNSHFGALLSLQLALPVVLNHWFLLESRLQYGLSNPGSGSDVKYYNLQVLAGLQFSRIR